MSAPVSAPMPVSAPRHLAIKSKTNATVALIEQNNMTNYDKNERNKSVKEFRRAMRAFTQCLKASRVDDLILLDTCGAFDALADDIIVKIIEFLMDIQYSGGIWHGDSSGYLEEANATRANTFHFSFTCKRMHGIFHNVATKHRAEMLARGSTSILPRNTNSLTPFTEQMCAELTSCDQLVMLRAACKQMACHCAKKCCHRYQKCFNKDLQQGNVFPLPTSPRLRPHHKEFKLLPIFESCSLLAPSLFGNVAFAYVRERAGRSSPTGESRGNRFVDTIVKVNREGGQFPIRERVEMAFDDMSSPLTMRAAHDGSAVLFICALHDTGVSSNDSAKLSGLWFWDTKQPPQRVNLEGRCDNPQDAWFVDNESGEGHKFTVACSTGFFHSSGHELSANGGESDAVSLHSYCFQTYCVDGGNIDHEETTCEYEGCLLVSCSPTESGRRVVALSKEKTTIPGRLCRSLIIHDIDYQNVQYLTSNVKHTKGALCAAISHSGDCVASLHKTKDSIVLEIAVTSAPYGYSVYTPVQKLDITHYLELPTDPAEGALVTDLVKATYELVFSPCNRFVSVVDRRPLFGEPALNHGIVTIDLSLRLTFNGLRQHPLFATSDQAPRSFHWTRTGIWLLPPGTDDNGTIGPRGGALCVYAPKTVSFD